MVNEPSMEQDFISRLTVVVEKNLDDNSFGVGDLADEVGISRSQLHRKLKEQTGQSPSQFIREIRLRHAMELLQANVATVSEIAYRVGFGSPSYFSKCFHDYYGFPPGEASDRASEKDKNLPRREEDVGTVYSKFGHLFYFSVGLTCVLLLVGGYLYYQYRLDTGPKNNQSVAVLPLDNLTGDSTQTYYVQGLHDALIGKLGQIGDLRVVSRTSTLQFGKKGTDLEIIADRLGVDHIIEGSVYSVHDSVRIQVQLIRVEPEEEHLWAQSYSRDTRNILYMLHDVSKDIADNIEITLSPERVKGLNNNRTVNPETYKAYLRGMYYINKSSRDDVRKGLKYLHKAVEHDPTDPGAYAGLAQGYINIGHGPTPSRDAFLKAESAALRAIKLDSMQARALSALASFKLYHERDWEGAEKAFQRANKLNPNLPWNHYHYAWYLHLIGRKDAAISEHVLAHELDPLNPYINGWLAWLYAEYGKYDLARREAEETLLLDENHPVGLLALGHCYIGQKKYNKAVAVLKKAAAVSPARRGELGHSLILAGRTDEAKKILDELLEEEMSSYNALQIAIIYANLGNYDKAFRWISYDPAHAITPWAARVIYFDSLRNDTRYNDFLARFNLFPKDKTMSASR